MGPADENIDIFLAERFAQGHRGPGPTALPVRIPAPKLHGLLLGEKDDARLR
jgi:hypothetical protein